MANQPLDMLERITKLEVRLEGLTAESHRVVEALNTELHKANAKIDELSTKCSYYDKAALKYGSFVMGVVTLGALLTMGLDKAKEKLLGAILP